jgi:succinoglycan biosynthesis protein ExoA
MNEAPALSIIMACRNEKAHIRDFLESLLAQDLSGMAWEAVIADGMSDDGTREILDEYCHDHPQLHLVENHGRIVSTGLNRAILTARGNIILRMDAHTQYARDYCRRCVETLDRTGADNVGGPARTSVRGTRARAIAAAYHSRFSTGGGKFHDENYEGWVDTVPYGCWRRTTLEQIGFFDENLVRNQDDELNLRLLRSGGRIWQARDIVSWYSPRGTLSSLFHQYFQYGFWKVAVIRKHRLPGAWRHIVPCSFVLANVFFLAGAITGEIAGWGPAVRWCASLWVAVAFFYAAASVTASVAAAHRHGWATLPYLPGAFAAYHLAYGLGFLIGIVSRCWQPGGILRQASLLTRVTR